MPKCSSRDLAAGDNEPIFSETGVRPRDTFSLAAPLLQVDRNSCWLSRAAAKMQAFVALPSTSRGLRAGPAPGLLTSCSRRNPGRRRVFVSLRASDYDHDYSAPTSTAPLSTQPGRTAASVNHRQRRSGPAVPLLYDRRRRPNALISETSRYLVDSAYDAVRWYPWGQQAFDAARAAHKPILLSSGFLSCHMCDVMSEHFRDPALAALLNKRFICIKVDREERPDVDSVYNSFVQAVTGRTGWPLTCFLTPELVPFVGATYLPKDRLSSAVESIADRWENNRAKVEADGVKVLGALRDLFEQGSHDPSVKIGPEMLRKAFHTADTCFDVAHGGFGSAPKFPRPSVFDFLFSMHLSGGLDERLRAESLDMVLDSLREMAAGGIHDHIGGGFFRYALDAAWQVPHFEKILSDQAQLASCYLNAYLITKDSAFRHVTCKTLDFVMAEMRDPSNGSFYSAIHADSESQFDVNNAAAEGAYYTFSSFELMLMLGEPASTIFNMRYGIEPAGNVSDSAVAKAELGSLEGLNVLRISASVPEISSSLGLPEKEVRHILQTATRKVFEERSRRPRPPTDDLAITCWNALAITALARAGAALDRQDYVDAAITAANVIMTRMVVRQDRKTDSIYLARAFRGNRGRVGAFAEDYAYAVQAFIDIYEVTGETKYLVFARQLQNALDLEFWEDGGYTTAKKTDKYILLRRKEDYDGAEPSSSSVAALNLVRLSSLLGDEALLDRANDIASSFSRVLDSSPLAMPMLLVTVQALAAESKRVVVVGDNDQASNMLSAYWSRGLPRSVALLRVPLEGIQDSMAKYLSQGRQRIASATGRVCAFVCTGQVCLEPTGNVQRFCEELDYLRAVPLRQEIN